MRINAVIAEQAAVQNGLADILGKLDTGDLVRAKVLEITSGELLLKLFDGTVFRASAAAEIEAAPGESLELIVKGKHGGTLVLETVKKSGVKTDSMDNEAVKLLEGLKIKADKKSMDIAAEIKKAGVNATRDLFEKATLLLNTIKALTPEKAVFLSNKGISAGSASINSAIRLLEGSLMLGSQLDELYSLITKLTEGSIGIKGTSADTGALNILKPALGSINIDNNGINDELAGSALSERNEANVNMPDARESAGKRTISGSRSDNPGFINGNLAQLPPNDININTSIALENKRDNNMPFTKVINKTISNEPDIFEILEPGEESLPYRQKDNEIVRQGIRELADKLKESFKSLFVRTDSENLSSELDARKVYRDILDKLDSIKQINQALSLPERTEINLRVNDIEEGIRLLNQIGTNNYYVQIPLNLSGFITTGELYIIKKEKNKKRIDPQNAIVLIALDTQNLGRVETMIDVKGRNVGIKLRAEAQNVLNFFKDNYKYLYSSLMDKGFRLVDVKYRLLEERINPVNAEHAVNRELKEGRVSVDLKI